MRHSTPERILIAGAGALGCVFGGLLARSGHAVTLLGRDGMMDAIRNHGLIITGIWGNHHIAGLTCLSEIDRLAGPYDRIFISVKSWDTHSMAQAIAPHLANNGLAVSLQNGLGNLEALAQAVGVERCAGARVIFGAEVGAPGQVTVTVYAAPVLIGTLTPATPSQTLNIDRLVAALNSTPIPTQKTDQLEAALWGKLLYNAALNPLGALLGCRYGELAESAHSRAVMDPVIDEAFAVAHALEVPLEWAHAAAYRQHFYTALIPATADHRSSMLQDLQAGRATEIDAINGQISQHGEQLGIPTPVNDTLVQMIRFRSPTG